MDNIIEIARQFNLAGIVAVLLAAAAIYLFTFRVLIPWKENLTQKLSQSGDPAIVNLTLKKELPRTASWLLSAGVRIPLYAVLLMALLSTFRQLDLKLGHALKMLSVCIKQKGNCAHTHAGYLKTLPALPGEATIPCRFVGVWSMTEGSSNYTVSLFETGYYKREGTEVDSDGVPTHVSDSGYWTVQDEKMIWIKGGNAVPDIDTIVMRVDGEFRTLGGGNEEHYFRWFSTLGTETCVGNKNQFAIDSTPVDDSILYALINKLYVLKKMISDRLFFKHDIYVSTQAGIEGGIERDYAEQLKFQIEQSSYLHYPITDRDGHITGSVRAMISILPDGSVKQVEILDSSGEPVLDEIATHIVHLAEPFAPFPIEMKDSIDRLEIIQIWEF